MKLRIRLLSSAAVAGLAAAAVALSASAAVAPSAKLSVKVSGSTAVATATLSHFAIDAMDVGKARMSGKGHLHFALDGGKFDYPKYSGANGQLAVKLGIAGKYSPAVTRSITYKHLPAGMHTLTVFIVNNDHSNTGAKATTRFVVK